MFNKKSAIQLTRKDCLTDARNQVLMRIVDLEIDIKLLEGMPADFIVGDKGVSQIIGGVQGKVAVKAKEAIELKQKQLFALNKKLEAIDALLAKVE